jgi:hypothetical protein
MLQGHYASSIFSLAAQIDAHKHASSLEHSAFRSATFPFWTSSSATTSLRQMTARSNCLDVFSKTLLPANPPNRHGRSMTNHSHSCVISSNTPDSMSMHSTAMLLQELCSLATHLLFGSSSTRVRIQNARVDWPSSLRSGERICTQLGLSSSETTFLR